MATWLRVARLPCKTGVGLFDDGLALTVALVCSCRDYIDSAVRHVMMRQGILGVKVVIMLPHDPKGINGPKTPLSDVVTILEPKEDATAY